MAVVYFISHTFLFFVPCRPPSETPLSARALTLGRYLRKPNCIPPRRPFICIPAISHSRLSFLLRFSMHNISLFFLFQFLFCFYITRFGFLLYGVSALRNVLANMAYARPQIDSCLGLDLKESCADVSFSPSAYIALIFPRRLEVRRWYRMDQKPPFDNRNICIWRRRNIFWFRALLV